jgi:hypothetical protein
MRLANYLIEVIILSIRDKINNGNFASKVDPSIVKEYNKYKKAIQCQQDDTVIHHPDKVDIVFKYTTTENIKTGEDAYDTYGSMTSICEGSHVDSDPQTDDFIQVQKLISERGKQLQSERVDYIETMDNGKQVIVKKEWTKDKKTKCTEVDTAGLVLDEWTSDSK